MDRLQWACGRSCRPDWSTSLGHWAGLSPRPITILASCITTEDRGSNNKLERPRANSSVYRESCPGRGRLRVPSAASRKRTAFLFTHSAIDEITYEPLLVSLFSLHPRPPSALFLLSAATLYSARLRSQPLPAPASHLLLLPLVQLGFSKVS